MAPCFLFANLTPRPPPAFAKSKPAGREPATLWRHEIDETLAKVGGTIHLKIEREGKPLDIDLPLRSLTSYRTVIYRSILSCLSTSP